MAPTLPVKRGISAPALNNIPDKWSKEWFRSFITQFLVDIDLRNALTSGITIAGNVSGNNSSHVGTPVTAGLSPIPTGTVLGNVSGTTATPVPLTPQQLAGIISTVLTPGIGVYGISGQQAVLKVNTGGSGSYTLVAAQGASGPQFIFGFLEGGYGSISPTTLYGYTIHRLESLIDTTVNNSYTDTLQLNAASDPGVSLFTSITVGSKTRTSSGASYLYTGGLAKWTWSAGGSSNGLFTATGSTAVNIT